MTFPRVCLERTVEIEGARLRLRDWPGSGGPLVHVADPLLPNDLVVNALAAWFAPRYRVVSLEPRAGQPYQIQTADLWAMLHQFGFSAPILVGQRLGCVAALLVAAWYPESVARLILVDQIVEAPAGQETSIEARALKECPPDRATLRRAVKCPVLELCWAQTASAQDLQTFVRLP